MGSSLRQGHGTIRLSRDGLGPGERTLDTGLYCLTRHDECVSETTNLNASRRRVFGMGEGGGALALGAWRSLSSTV